MKLFGSQTAMAKKKKVFHSYLMLGPDPPL